MTVDPDEIKRDSGTEVQIAGVESLVVHGTVKQVEKELSDAARSGQSRLAWLTERDTDQPIALNPAHVISLRPQSTPVADSDADADRR
jgi:hypothetical protein